MSSSWETAAVWVHTLVTISSAHISILLLTYIFLFWPIGRLFVIAYCCYIYYEYENVVQNGGKRWEWYRNCYYFKLLAKYFNMKIVALHKLNPNKNYIFAGHPHGNWCVGTIIGTTFNCCGVDSAYPHHKLSLITTKYNTCMPIQREYLVYGGVIYATAKSMINALTKLGPGRAVVVMAGGARETLVSDFETQRARALGHKGFCRIALQCGAPIVPFYVFGETDTIKTIHLPDGWRKKLLEFFQNWMFKITGGTFIIGKSDQFFVPNFYPFPRRCSITFVSGKPIDIEKIENPTKDEVNELHKEYLIAIKELYDKEKNKYLRDPSQELEFCY